MRIPPDDPEKENPESWSDDIGVQGIEALPGKVQRYSKAKRGALDVADYMGSVPAYQGGKLLQRLTSCGDYLVFRHYFTVDRVRLHGASLCMKHLLCPLCAIRRGAKALKAYLDRFELIKGHYKPFLVTLTVKDGPDLAERFKHLMDSQHELWKQKHRSYVNSPLAGVVGAVWSYEVKRGKGSGLWHPHLHMIALAECMPDAADLAEVWRSITGDSFIVDVRPISQEDPVSGFLEVFKYAVKFSNQPPADTVHAFETLSGKRLLGSAGCFRGVVVPDDLLDGPEALEGLPFATLFYRFLNGGYSLGRSH